MGRSVETGNSIKKATIFYAGDSTVQFNSIDTYPQTGLGQVLPRFVHEEYVVSNHGKNGRSTKSFIDEGRLDVIKEKINEGDYLFIQFGHNDEKAEDPLRYTKPDDEYEKNLAKFIGVARDKGAYPVLITPIERCHFENGCVYKGFHGDYVNAMKRVGSNLQVPVIDLYEKTRNIMNALGESEAKKPYVKDGTHMTMEGAVKYCYELAYGLKELGEIYSQILIDEL